MRSAVHNVQVLVLTDFDPVEDALVLNCPDVAAAEDDDAIMLMQNGDTTEVYVNFGTKPVLMARLIGVQAIDIDPDSIAVTSLDADGLNSLVA